MSWEWWEVEREGEGKDGFFVKTNEGRESTPKNAESAKI